MIIMTNKKKTQTQSENYNEEWGEISLNLTALEKRENPIQKGLRLIQEQLISCTNKKDKNLCILLLIDLDVSNRLLFFHCIIKLKSNKF